MQRPDLRDLTTNIADALGEMDREALLAILTFVFKEYVVDGPPPMLMHQAETVAELQGLSFAQLIATLQTRLDLPELALFQVDGERVSVRVGGALQPLQPPRTMPALEPARPAGEVPATGVRVVEASLINQPRRPSSPADEAQARGRGELAGAAAGAPPPRAGGVSVRSQAGGAMTGVESRPAPAAQPGTATPAAAPAAGQGAAPDKPAEGDDATARFSLLELD